MIIDVHAHLGHDRVYDEDFTQEDLIDKANQFAVDLTIVQPALVHTIEEVYEQHEAIYTLTQKYEGKFLGMANPNPHLPDDIYLNEVKRCINELGFVGIKIHAAAHACDPTSQDGQKVFRIARALKVPVMIHTGAGIPFANPSNVVLLAKEYSDVPIVLAHCGMMIMAGETLLALKNASNVFADITWTGGFLLKQWISLVGANRFLFGTDHADNCGTELAKVRTSGLTEEEQEWILHRSASKVYNLPRFTKSTGDSEN